MQTRQAAARYCETRRALFIADPLSAWQDVSDIVSGASGLGSGDWGLSRTAAAAVYVPHLHVDLAAADAPVRCAPCGAVAGVMARADRTAGPWTAAAGPTATLRGVIGLSQMMTEHEIGALAAVGVNTLRMVPQVGPVVWGARTHVSEYAPTPEFKYVPVRRTAWHLETSIERGTSWAVDETNDERLWGQIRQQVGNFLHALFRLGAFPGTTPQDAFFVRCDASTMTSEDIAAGHLSVVVGFAPLKPAEFVVITVKQGVRPPTP